MNPIRFLLVFVLVVSSFVVVNVAHAETRTVSFSPLNYIFDSGYIVEKALLLFPESEVLTYDSESYPGVVLVGSRGAVLTTFFDVPTAEYQAVLDEVFCLVTSSVVVAYGEKDAYEVLLVRIAIDEEILSFTTVAFQLTTVRQGCD